MGSPLTSMFLIISSCLVALDDFVFLSNLVSIQFMPVCSSRKQINLGFRGSVTRKDYETDTKIFMRKEANPLAAEPHQSKVFYLHRGFAGYLLDKLDHDRGSKFEKIHEQLGALFRQYPSYRLYVTGHSLGGALATIATFMLATLPEVAGDELTTVPEIPGCITLITFGAPLVGDLHFRRAFQAVEQMDKIRCLRVVNQSDLVPLVPRREGRVLVNLFRCRSMVYRHVGNELRLYRNLTYVISRPPEARVYLGSFVKDIPQQIIHVTLLADTIFCRRYIFRRHSVKAYSENLTAVEKPLKKVYLNDLYVPRWLRAVRYGGALLGDPGE